MRASLGSVRNLRKNIKWWAKLGSETYCSPVIANGMVFVGTNNANGYLKRYPSSVDLGCMLAFDAATEHTAIKSHHARRILDTQHDVVET